MHFCDNTFCNGYNNEKFTQNYRFPFCSVFLRPASKYVNEESKLITTGVHIPVCEVKKLIKNSNSFTKSDAYFKNISHQIFDELFNTNMIGSKWIKINELELFYKKIGIESNIDRIKIYAQEFNKELLFEDEADDFF